MNYLDLVTKKLLALAAVQKYDVNQAAALHIFNSIMVCKFRLARSLEALHIKIKGVYFRKKVCILAQVD